MQHQQILPVLYDLSVTIGSEIRLKQLLTRTLQRLLYHTSFSAGFVCLDMPACEGAQVPLAVCISAAVGDFELIAQIGNSITVPCALVYGCASQELEPTPFLAALGLTRSHYQAFYRLPLEHNGAIVLLAMTQPETNFDLAQVLTPVLTQLSKAIVLCRAHDAQLAAAAAQQEILQQSLAQVEGEFQVLMAISPMGVGLSSDGIIMDANDAFLQLFGYARIEDLRGQVLTNCIAPQQRDKIWQHMTLRAQGLTTQDTYETVGLRQDGTQFPFMVSSRRLQTPQGPRTFSYFVDLTEQKRAEEQLRAVNRMMRLVLETAPLRIFWKDKDSRYLGCNRAFAHDAGLNEPDELVGKLDSDMGWHEQAELYRADDQLVMTSKTPRLNFEEPQTTPEGQQIWLRTSKVPLIGTDGQEMGVLGIYDDITAQKQAQAQIEKLAYFDTLTGLPNRQQVIHGLHQAMETSEHSQRWCALLFLDLDDFKSLNDAKGLHLGDKLLIEVGARLKDCVRDHAMVARPGGDEFIVLLEGLGADVDDAAAQAELVAEKIRHVVNQKFELGNVVVHTTPSIGVVMFRGLEPGSDSLLKHADAAMYQAKKAGRNTISFFDPQVQTALEARLGLVEDLARAQEQGQLLLYFQKQVNAQGRTMGAEVLIRWQHPQRGLVSPAQFIPLAEETGIIMAMGLWVLQAACRQLKSWQARPITCDLTLSVNVSAKQFHQDDFVEQVRRTLVETGAKPSHLKLELTESIVLKNVEDTIAKMRELKLLGISFSMDDFGTGYSSLQYLKRLPLDQIKIDQGFVRDITTDANDAAIVQTIIAMTEALGLNVIAEGVETDAQRTFLEQRGCHSFQGYFFGRPVPLAQFEADLCQDKT